MMFNLCLNSMTLSVFRIVKYDVQFMSEQYEQLIRVQDYKICSVFRIVK